MVPRYYFDTDDDDQAHVDDEGTILPSDEHARKHAQDALPDMARDKMPDGNERRFVATVRDEAGRVIYQVTLTLKGKGLEPPGS